MLMEDSEITIDLAPPPSLTTTLSGHATRGQQYGDDAHYTRGVEAHHTTKFGFDSPAKLGSITEVKLRPANTATGERGRGSMVWCEVDPRRVRSKYEEKKQETNASAPDTAIQLAIQLDRPMDPNYFLDEIKCPICWGVLSATKIVNKSEGTCMHRYCGECLSHYLRNHRQYSTEKHGSSSGPNKMTTGCPLCKTPITTMRSASDDGRMDTLVKLLMPPAETIPKSIAEDGYGPSSGSKRSLSNVPKLMGTLNGFPSKPLTSTFAFATVANQGGSITNYDCASKFPDVFVTIGLAGDSATSTSSAYASSASAHESRDKSSNSESSQGERLEGMSLEPEGQSSTSPGVDASLLSSTITPSPHEGEVGDSAENEARGRGNAEREGPDSHLAALNHGAEDSNIASNFQMSTSTDIERTSSGADMDVEGDAFADGEGDTAEGKRLKPMTMRQSLQQEQRELLESGAVNLEFYKRMHEANVQRFRERGRKLQHDAAKRAEAAVKDRRTAVVLGDKKNVVFRLLPLIPATAVVPAHKHVSSKADATTNYQRNLFKRGADMQDEFSVAEFFTSEGDRWDLVPPTFIDIEGFSDLKLDAAKSGPRNASASSSSSSAGGAQTQSHDTHFTHIPTAMYALKEPLPVATLEEADLQQAWGVYLSGWIVPPAAPGQMAAQQMLEPHTSSSSSSSSSSSDNITPNSTATSQVSHRAWDAVLLDISRQKLLHTAASRQKRPIAPADLNRDPILLAERFKLAKGVAESVLSKPYVKVEISTTVAHIKQYLISKKEKEDVSLSIVTVRKDSDGLRKCNLSAIRRLYPFDFDFFVYHQGLMLHLEEDISLRTICKNLWDWAGPLDIYFRPRDVTMRDPRC